MTLTDATLLALAALGTLAACAVPEPGITSMAVKGECVLGDCTSEMLDYDPDRVDPTVVDWAPYLDRVTGREVQAARAGHMIVTPGNTMSQAEADRWLPW